MALLWITICAGLLFAVLNLLYASVALAVVELVMVVYSGLILIAIRKTAHVERWIMAYLVPFFAAMMFAMTTPRSTPSVFAWILLVPILSHLLLGRRLGFAMALFFIAVAGVIFFLKHGDDPELMQVLPIANLTIVSLSILAFSHVYEVSRERSELRLLRLAQTDFLTGLANRSRFKDIFDREKQRSLREQTPLSLLVIDLDYFKEVNDRFGHEAGDAALVYVAHLLNRRLRATDLACRLGGEEFGVILVDTPGELAVDVAEDLRHTLEHSPFPNDGQPINLTMSVGVAQFGIDGSSLRSLLAAADARLYRGKSDGRNRVVGSLATPTRGRRRTAVLEEVTGL